MNNQAKAERKAAQRAAGLAALQAWFNEARGNAAKRALRPPRRGWQACGPSRIRKLVAKQHAKALAQAQVRKCAAMSWRTTGGRTRSAH